MKQPPFTSSISVTDGTLSEYGNHIVRHLSAMNRQYLVGQAYAATAIALPLFNKPSAGDRPRRFVKVGHSQGWTDRINQMLGSVKTCIPFIYILNEDPMRNDGLMAAMPPGIFINATGMGKDLPGSPITGQDLIQRNGIAWELNYRGDLALCTRRTDRAGRARFASKTVGCTFCTVGLGVHSSLSPGNCRRAV